MKGFEGNPGEQKDEATEWDNLTKLKIVAKESINSYDDKEALDSDIAEDILPYLTLDRLSDHEKTEVLRLSDDAVKSVFDPNNSFNVFDNYEVFGSKLAAIVNKGEDWDAGNVPYEVQQARKLFCASLFDNYNKQDSDKNKEQIYGAFFSMSPSILSYCGNLNDSLELFDVAERTNSNSCARGLYEDIVYEQSFSQGNDFEEVLGRADPIKQLRLLPIIYNISNRCWPNDWSSVALDKISVAFDALENDENTTPLSRIVAGSLGRQIDQRFNEEWIDIDMSNPEHIELIERHEKYKADLEAQQARLHQEFPKLPDNQYVARVAPGIAGAFPGARLNLIADTHGNQMSLLDYNKDNNFGINRDEAYLIESSHNPEVKDLIDKNLGLDLADISLDAQIQLLKYMTNAKDERFVRLCDGLHRADDGVRLKLAEGFLAADFGEDFGDYLLDIAESKRISSEQLESILDNVESCRESIRGIVGLYKDYDVKFAESYARAANERLTDAIMVFRQIAKTGRAEADLGWFGEAGFGYEEALEALKYEVKSLSIINGTLNDVKNGRKGAFCETVLPSEYYSQFNLYNFYSPEHGYVLLYTRPEGSGTFDETIEYGKFRSKYDEANNNTGVEASISMIANPVDPFSLPKPYKPNRKALKNPHFYDESTMDKVSAIRLDREGRDPNAPVDDPERNPMNKIGTVSVDLAAINDRADTPSGKIARLFSVGNKLRKEQAGTGFSLNHNTHWFEQDKYGTSDGFKGLVEYVDSLASKWSAEHKPSKDVESFRKLMREFGRRTNQAAA